MNRTIHLTISSEARDRIAAITGTPELSRALGYLCQWNLSHPWVEVTGDVYDGNPELIATYRSEEAGPITYQIGAVWDGAGHFGFHS